MTIWNWFFLNKQKFDKNKINEMNWSKLYRYNHLLDNLFSNYFHVYIFLGDGGNKYVYKTWLSGDDVAEWLSCWTVTS